MQARSLLIGIAIAFGCRNAKAEGALEITTVEYGAWGATVAALQVDLRGEGKTVQVLVKEGTHTLPCGTYALNPDEAGSRAFRIGACNPSTGATLLTLISRSALFDHEGGTSTPRAIGIVATRVETASTSGGAVVKAESAVSCSADVTPYMPNLESGTRALLAPDRYELHPRTTDVRVTHDSTHWTLSRTSAGSIPYDVIDLHSGKVVFSDRVDVSCSSSGSAIPVPIIPQQTSDPVVVLKPNLGQPDRIDDASEWRGHALTASFAPGVAVLVPNGLTFKSAEWGSASAQDLGLGATAAPSFGLAVTYERPWLYASFGGNVAFAESSQNRTLYELGGVASAGVAVRIGILSIYGGPSLALSTHQLSAQNDGARFEWSSGAEWGFGANAGVRAHVMTGGSTLAVVGFDMIAPIVGHQPWFFVASFGFGGGR